MVDIGANLEAVQRRIADAAERAGRDPAEIRLLAVSKRIDQARIEAALAVGVDLLGESRVQEAEEKIPLIGSDPSWHFIGPLQRNKAALAARLFDVVHSVDRAALLDKLSASARQCGRNVDVFVQVERIDAVLDGAALAEIVALCRQAQAADSISLAGLMMMAPYATDPEASRPYFRGLAQIRDTVAEQAGELPELGLSMGMSGDFEVAVEEGATIVRVGTAIFGERAP